MALLASINYSNRHGRARRPIARRAAHNILLAPNCVREALARALWRPTERKRLDSNMIDSRVRSLAELAAAAAAAIGRVCARSFWRWCAPLDWAGDERERADPETSELQTSERTSARHEWKSIGFDGVCARARASSFEHSQGHFPAAAAGAAPPWGCAQRARRCSCVSGERTESR